MFGVTCLQGYNGNDSNSWTPVDYPCSVQPDAPRDCTPYCVFDVYADPSERNDLAGNATLLASLLTRYEAIGNEPVNWHDRPGSKLGGRPPNDDYKTTCAYMAARGGYWRPWHSRGYVPPWPPLPPPPPPPIDPAALLGTWRLDGRGAETLAVSSADADSAANVFGGQVGSNGGGLTIVVNVTSGTRSCWDTGVGLVHHDGRSVMVNATGTTCTRLGSGIVSGPPLKVAWTCSYPDGKACSWPDWVKA